MDLVQLKYFIRVAELRSFSKAATALHIAQPAITRQIRLLEEELGVPLLHRHSRGSEPTEAGQLLKTGAKAILRLVEQVHGEVVSRALVPAGAVRLGFPPSVGNLLIGSVVSVYRERYPNVSISLVEGFNQVMQEWILSDRVDIAIMTGFGGHPLLESRPLYDESLWLLGPRKSPGPQRRSFTIQDLAERPLIQTSHENTLRMMLERVSASRGFALNIVIQAEALSVIKDLVRRGVGYHVSPYSAVFGDVERGDFSGGPIRELSISRFLVYRNDRRVTRAVIELSKLIVEELKNAAIIAGPSIRVASALAGGGIIDILAAHA